jgi:hypothetical protein
MITRKAFLIQLTGGGFALTLGGCGGGGSSSESGGAGDPGALSSACGSWSITNNHGHALRIPPADLDATSSRSYLTEGFADHRHGIVLSAAQLAALKAGQEVTVKFAAGTPDGHTHDAAGRCA